MSRRKVRFFFCLLLVATLIVDARGKRQVVLASTPLVLDQPAPLATRTYRANNTIPLRDWPTPEHLMYQYGVAIPADIPPAYYDPAFNGTMIRYRSAILASARRHNREEITHLTDDEFAVMLAAQLYFEYNSALSTRGPLLRTITPIYQEAQNVANLVGVGNFSVWPANIRPSVASSLLRGEMPYIDEHDDPASLHYPITIAGSKLQAEMLARRLEGWQPSDRDVAEEIAQPALAIEYMAANFEIATYRAEFDLIPISWMTLAAWHNQGIVSPSRIAHHPHLGRVLPGVARYFPGALKLIYAPPQPLPALVRTPLAR